MKQRAWAEEREPRPAVENAYTNEVQWRALDYLNGTKFIFVFE